MNLHKRLTLKVLAIFAIGFAIVSCDNDDPEPVNEEELITTVNVTFTNTANAGDVVTATFQDLDGPGGNAATQSNLALSANSTYTVSIEFLNEQETPAEDITEEVAEEDDEHQVFYVATAGLNFTFAYTDQDGDGNPLGLAGTATTGAASTGSVTVSLIHEPTKTGAGVSDGDPTNANGETDVEVTFTTTIQ
ncbi:hypothetical protein [Roseivirga sp.]|uniref:hypothetical protein n=1 Tax=Roseivirga sp. TaxID=1964215 RepID=UPI003B8CEABD